MKASKTFRDHLRLNEIIIKEKGECETYAEDVPSWAWHVIDGICHALDALQEELRNQPPVNKTDTFFE